MASIRDIAKLAGVSAASVSRILNNDQSFSINENTRQRVIEIANSLNYSKDKSQKKNRDVGDSNTIALITRHDENSERNDPYFLSIRRGIEGEAAKWRLKTIRAFSMRDPQRNVAELAKYGAVIIIGEMTEEALQQISQVNAKIVLVDSYDKKLDFDCVQTDFAQKTHEILDLLKSKGHQNIAFIGGTPSRVDAQGEAQYQNEEVRAESYKNWMILNKLEEYTHVYQGRWSPETGVRYAEELLDLQPRPTAVVVASDPMAVGVYKAILSRGLRIPEDISVISFDDIEMAQFMTPGLSTVRMNTKEMGQISVDLAKGRILSSRTMPVRVVCKSELIIRESIADIN